jgi:hypothetical protein
MVGKRAVGLALSAAVVAGWVIEDAGPANAQATASPKAKSQAKSAQILRRPTGDSFVYPMRAQNLEIEGVTTVTLAIDETGKVSGCTPVSNLGGGLEEETCKVWMRYGRFTPAQNAAGAPVASTMRTTVKWVMPEPAPQPAPAPAYAASAPAPDRQPGSLQTVQCDTGSGFNIWRVDLNSDLIVEQVSGQRLTINNITGTKILANSDPDFVDSYTELDLTYHEDASGAVVITYQSVFRTSGWGAATRTRRFGGACRRRYG